MSRHRLAKLACLLANRGAAITVLVLVAVVHPLVHGTPIDGGALDAVFSSIQMWAVGNLHAGAD